MFDRISVELGSDLIRIVRGKPGKRIKVDYWSQVDINNSTRIIEENGQDKLGEILLAEFKKNKLGKRNVNFVLSCLPNLLIREMVIPYVKEKEAYNIIKFEARDYFPVDLENYTIDYKVAEVFKEDKTKKQRIVAVIVPKSMVEKVVSISKSAGININSIDIEANALVKLINNYRSIIGHSGEETIMALNIEKSFVTAVIARKGIMTMAKTFSYDLSRFHTDRPDEVPDFEKQYILNDIVESMVKVGSFYSSRESTNVEKIYTAGCLANHEDINRLLREKTGLDIEVLGNGDFLEGKTKMPQTEICTFAAAVGGIV